MPSFAAVKSLLDTSTCSITRCAFTPILPYPATEFDTIFTTMINYDSKMSCGKEDTKTAHFGQMRECTTLRRRYNFYIQRSLVTSFSGLEAFIWKKLSSAAWVRI